MPLVGLLSQTWTSLRSTSVWPVPRPTLEYQASSRLRELATPRVRNNIWSRNMSEVGALLSSGAPPSTRGAGGPRQKGHTDSRAACNTQDSQVSAQDRAPFRLKPARGHLPCPRGLKVGPRPSAHTRASQRAWNRSVRSEPNTSLLPLRPDTRPPLPRLPFSPVPVPGTSRRLVAALAAQLTSPRSPRLLAVRAFLVAESRFVPRMAPTLFPRPLKRSELSPGWGWHQ